MTNGTSTDVPIASASCNRVIAKQDDSHSTATANNQINEDMIQSTLPVPHSATLSYNFITEFPYIQHKIVTSISSQNSYKQKP